MEIYTYSADRVVSLEVPVAAEAGTLVVTASKNGEVVHTFNTVNTTATGYSVTLPFSLIQDDNTITISWTFDYIEDGTTFTFNRETFVEVVTPILPLAEIKAIADDDELTDAEIAEIEKATRYIIQAHTGQNFGRAKTTKTVFGDGSGSLALPGRLLALEEINGAPAPSYFNVVADGWYINHGPVTVPSLKADYYGIHESNGVISNPYGGNVKKFLKGQRFNVKGTWGWNDVPAAVKEAAKLLVNDYASGDTIYRDRYLLSMTAADWRIQFTAGAFQHTGNVRADHLLSEFVLKRGWAVI